ncbi:MAG: collagen-like triple helix repeat-containing protein [Candidatus Latescibacterota bacterium]|nr:collagen-like triple helix repeat-containing protein [Candidatus Latescibacterota bacterium]
MSHDGEGTDGAGEDEQEQAQKGLDGEDFELDEGFTQEVGEGGEDEKEDGGDGQEREAAFVFVVCVFGWGAFGARWASGHGMKI